MNPTLISPALQPAVSSPLTAGAQSSPQSLPSMSMDEVRFSSATPSPKTDAEVKAEFQSLIQTREELRQPLQNYNDPDWMAIKSDMDVAGRKISDLLHGQLKKMLTEVGSTPEQFDVLNVARADGLDRELTVVAKKKSDQNPAFLLSIRLMQSNPDLDGDRRPVYRFFTNLQVGDPAQLPDNPSWGWNQDEANRDTGWLTLSRRGRKKPTAEAFKPFQMKAHSHVKNAAIDSALFLLPDYQGWGYNSYAESGRRNLAKVVVGGLSRLAYRLEESKVNNLSQSESAEELEQRERVQQGFFKLLAQADELDTLKEVLAK